MRAPRRREGRRRWSRAPTRRLTWRPVGAPMTTTASSGYSTVTSRKTAHCIMSLGTTLTAATR
eukprot:3982698-Pyramimonas_sp.AAC.1